MSNAEIKTSRTDQEMTIYGILTTINQVNYRFGISRAIMLKNLFNSPRGWESGSRDSHQIRLFYLLHPQIKQLDTESQVVRAFINFRHFIFIIYKTKPRAKQFISELNHKDTREWLIRGWWVNCKTTSCLLFYHFVEGRGSRVPCRGSRVLCRGSRVLCRGSRVPCRGYLKNEIK